MYHGLDQHSSGPGTGSRVLPSTIPHAAARTRRRCRPESGWHRWLPQPAEASRAERPSRSHAHPGGVVRRRLPPLRASAPARIDSAPWPAGGIRPRAVSISAAGCVCGSLGNVTQLPPGQRTVDGFPRFGGPVKPPAVPADPALEITGAVREPVTVPLSVLSTLPRTEQTSDFHCVAGWSAIALRWAVVGLVGLYGSIIEP